MDKVTREVADEEVKSWLDKKRVMAGERERFKEFIDILSDAICEGLLVLDSQTFKFTLTLAFPFGEETKIEKLVFEPRLNDKMLQPYLKGVKSDDAQGQFTGRIAALTKTPREVLAYMDSSDKKIAGAIAIFFA